MCSIEKQLIKMLKNYFSNQQIIIAKVKKNNENET